MPESKDVEQGLVIAVLDVQNTFDSLWYPEDWRPYFLSKVAASLQVQAAHEAVKSVQKMNTRA